MQSPQQKYFSEVCIARVHPELVSTIRQPDTKSWEADPQVTQAKPETQQRSALHDVNSNVSTTSPPHVYKS